ncbi:alpha/beta fold hydrolase [Aquincola sp. S2]|uniref:Alpha/beta fold hydrolase n=1 Tax=Pseudaquabacterium terrae TaxID=2732868 RepID=A0ABX2EAK9_9BURK|nr:alpha/beta fold hydrolase [Aquabacterium terrae]NRF66129.1 alpha/beta fold hydrolase [Aquabacterium terrae]
MNRETRRLQIEGPSGVIEAAADEPAGALRGVAVLCHPHPQHGGTMDNKVVQTLARAFVQLGYRAVRFNFRGVGGSAGVWDEGSGEIDDALAVIASQREDPNAGGLPLALGGFSFGGYVAAQATARLADSAPVERLVLIGPATSRFEVPAVPRDTVVIHGEADDVVPLAATLDWARPQVLPVIVLPGVGHFFHGQLTLLKSQVVQAWHQPNS